MRGDALAQLNVLISMSNVQECSPRAGQQVFIDVLLRKEPLGKFRGRHPTDVVPASIAPLSAMRPRTFKLQRSLANPMDTSFANDHGVSRVDGRGPKSS
jgi:hypothetical protein